MRTVVAAIVLAVCAGCGRSSSRPPSVPVEAQAAVVERVVDGDTFWARVDKPGGPLAARASHEIRMLEIDTPETVAPHRPVGCYGPEASAFTKAGLPVGSVVYLLPDKEDRDRYGRFLRYVWDARGQLFNDRAVRLGYAKTALYMPNDRLIGQLRAAEAEARAARRGLWGACPVSAPTPVKTLPTAPSQNVAPPGGVYYRSCDDARRAGAAPLHRGDGGYREALDGDGDGVACE